MKTVDFNMLVKASTVILETVGPLARNCGNRDGDQIDQTRKQHCASVKLDRRVDHLAKAGHQIAILTDFTA